MGLEKRPEWKDGLDEKTSGKDLQDDDDHHHVNPVRYGPTWVNRKD